MEPEKKVKVGKKREQDEARQKRRGKARGEGIRKGTRREGARQGGVRTRGYDQDRTRNKTRGQDDKGGRGDNKQRKKKS